MKDREALDFGKPLRGVRRYQGQDGGRYLSADQPGDRSGLPPLSWISGAPAATIAVRTLPLEAEYLSSIAIVLPLRPETDVMSGRAMITATRRSASLADTDAVFSALPRANDFAEPGSSVPIPFSSVGGAAAAIVKRSASIVAATTCVSIVLVTELSAPTVERESAMVAVVISESTAAAPPAEVSGLEISGGSVIRGGQRLGVQGGSAISGLQRRDR